MKIIHIIVQNNTYYPQIKFRIKHNFLAFPRVRHEKGQIKRVREAILEHYIIAEAKKLPLSKADR